MSKRRKFSAEFKRELRAKSVTNRTNRAARLVLQFLERNFRRQLDECESFGTDVQHAQVGDDAVDDSDTGQR